METAPATKIVRVYSFEAADRLPPDNPAHPLGQVLTSNAGDPATVDWPWRKFFEPYRTSDDKKDPISSVISVEAAKLQERWLDFQSNCNKADRLDLETCEPTMQSVVETVGKMDKAWQGKRKTGFRGKVTSRFHKVCGTLDSHQSLLKVLPEGSHYVSLFSGTLNAVITASVNYEHVAGGFADALCSISENVAYLNAEMEIFRTKAVLEKVADFYAHVFVFLSTFMDWMTRKRRMRLLDSFNENAASTFDADIKTLGEKAADIRHLVEQSSRAEVRATRLIAEETRTSLEGLARDVRVGLQGMARQQAEMEYAAQRWAAMQEKAHEERRKLLEDPRNFEDRLLALITHSLVDEAKRFLRDDPAKAALGTSPWGGGGFSQSANILLGGTTGSLLPTTTEWTAEAISVSSGHLEAFFYRDRVRIPCDIAGPIRVPDDLHPHLAGWISGSSGSSSIFWIDGPPLEADDYDNPLTMLATWTVHLAAQSGLPTISYFCELRRGDPLRSGNSWATQSLVALVSALLRQMVEWLLPRFEAEADLSEHRFGLLEGTIESSGVAMALFEDLGRLMPSGIICVIDGLQWVDENSTEVYVRELVGILRRSGFKVLLTTTGRAPSLRDAIHTSEALELETLDMNIEVTGLSEDIFGT